MARTKVAEEKKNEHGQNYIASPTGIANNNNNNNNNPLNFGPIERGEKQTNNID